MSANILNTIVSQKKQEVDALERTFPIADLKNLPQFNCSKKSLIQSITNSSNGIIAEFKRRSPSKNDINFKDSIQKIAQNYQEQQTAAMSVLTDTPFFGGSTTDLIQAKEIFKNPILRKDFTISSYQIYQAKAMGADVILLIAAILSKEEMSEFSKIAFDLDLEVIVEIHDEKELDKIPFGAHILYGINNRNLNNFEVNFENAVNLSEKLPNQAIKIAESGIKTPKDVQLLRKSGFKSFLIGEVFMKMDSTTNSFADFIKQASI